jgi:hypothetical protein
MREGRRPTGLTRLWLATPNLLRGLCHCRRRVAGFRQHGRHAALPVQFA